MEVGKLTRIENKHLYTLNIHRSWTPILPANRQFKVGKSLQVMRTQLPIRPSAAKTVHRSQGDTIEPLVVDFTGRSQPHIHYVACSRVKTLDGLFLKNFNAKKITVNSKVVQEMTRLRQTSTTNKQSENQSHKTESIKIVYINAQSLHKHIKDVRKDYRLEEAEFLVCAETRLKPSDSDASITLDSFSSIFRNDELTSSSQRPAHGMAIYTKPNIVVHNVIENKHAMETVVSKVYKTEGECLLYNIVSVYFYPNTARESIKKHIKSVIEMHQLSITPAIILGDFKN